jgi:membrane associated rhomboid family serine protease
MATRTRELFLGRVHMPRLIAGLMAAIALVSIAGAVGLRNGAAFIVEGSVLLGQRVWQGQLWRLVTWSLLELDPLGLLFACLTLYWFGSELCRTWGARRFAAFYFGVAAAAGACTVLIGLVWPVVGESAYMGSWPVLDATIIAWGTLFAGREIRLWGVLRMTGRHMVILTLAVTVLYALFYGLAAFIPHFAAELLTLAWLRLPRLTGWWTQRRKATLAARASAFDLQAWIDQDRNKGRRR